MHVRVSVTMLITGFKHGSILPEVKETVQGTDGFKSSTEIDNVMKTCTKYLKHTDM